jgi:hypothetical protein
VLGAGRIAHGGIGRIDLAAAAPLLTLWVAPRVSPRLPQFGGALAAVAAALLSVVLAVGLGAVMEIR